MKKNSIVLIITLLIPLNIISCISLDTIEKEPKQNNINSNTAEKNSDEDKKNINEDTKPYYGTWKIHRYVQIDTNNSLSPSKINSYIGTAFTISNDKITVSSSLKEEASFMNNPKFEEKDISNDDLKSTWTISFNNLGIYSNSVNMIIVSNYYISNNNDSKIGSNIIIDSNKRAYTIINGSFYELKKINTLN